MLNTLLFVHLSIAVLLIIVILLQKTSKDGLSGLSAGNNGMGLVSNNNAANFLTKTTVILATLFFINAIILANLSSKPRDAIKVDVEQETKKDRDSALPIAQ
ncbi:MAG TPA: preprotein translocase subunit SecG [Candidatus Megaira endosymbiont of Nemacystus decipiens]|nr:preprotein translocase subunit SecG [Candidatus Megaera endosymbiont of Nemacystus decipiens]